MYSQLSLSTDAEPIDPELSLYDTILYKGLEHGGALEPILHEYWGWL